LPLLFCPNYISNIAGKSKLVNLKDGITSNISFLLLGEPGGSFGIGGWYQLEQG
jgi:hypothetical protein